MFVRILINKRRPIPSQIAKYTGPTWGPPGSCRPQMGPMSAPWTLLSGLPSVASSRLSIASIWEKIDSVIMALHCTWLLRFQVVCFTKEVNLQLAKHPLVFNGHLANHRLTSFVKEATASWLACSGLSGCIVPVMSTIHQSPCTAQF